MKVVYVAGPFRSRSTPYSHWEQEQNIRNAERVALWYLQQGHAVICPQANTRNFQGAVEEEKLANSGLELLRRADIVCMSYGWPESEGSLVELRLAQKLGKEIHYVDWSSFERGGLIISDTEGYVVT